jgi:4'-phosphopantetheinyl transferase
MNRCSFDEIPVHWDANEVITFLADIGQYRHTYYNALDNKEKEDVQKFKTEYFRKRFTVSRTLLKHILLPILETDNPAHILLGKEKKGRIIIPTRPDICISLSYSGPYIAFSVGKQKIGCDIELLRPIKSKKIASSPVFMNYSHMDNSDNLQQIIHVWTLIESYAKLSDKNPYCLLNTSSLFDDTNFVSYRINKLLIFSLASGKKQFTDTLMWIDPHREDSIKSPVMNYAGV